MIEVKRYWCDWDNGTFQQKREHFDTEVVKASAYDAAKSELAAVRRRESLLKEKLADCEKSEAALREELAAQKETVALFESEYSKQSLSLAAAEQRNAILEAEIKKLTPWVKGVGSTKLRDHAYQLIASAPCEKCKGKGFIDFTDKDLRNANNGAWGRCLTCRPYDVSLTKPTESEAKESRAEHADPSCLYCDGTGWYRGIPCHRCEKPTESGASE